MMNYPLLVPKILERARTFFPDKEIVTRVGKARIATHTGIWLGGSPGWPIPFPDWAFARATGSAHLPGIPTATWKHISLFQPWEP